MSAAIEAPLTLFQMPVNTHLPNRVEPTHMPLGLALEVSMPLMSWPRDPPV